jgi:hypothetical protein
MQFTIGKSAVGLTSAIHKPESTLLRQSSARNHKEMQMSTVNERAKKSSGLAGLKMVGGAAAGAAAGSLAGPVGAAVGAVLGGIAGASADQMEGSKLAKRVASTMKKSSNANKSPTASLRRKTANKGRARRPARRNS